MNMTTNISGAIRTAVLSILLCCVVYTLVIWAIAQLFVPNTANGSLVKNEAGEYVGSRQVAQEFTQDKYFHSRPSAADYNGAGAVGSNLTPTSPKITERAREIIKPDSRRSGDRLRQRARPAYHAGRSEVSGAPRREGARHQRSRA